jgi:IPTL-CTERM motif
MQLSGTLQLENTTVSGNTATNRGGGISLYRTQGGHVLNIRSSTLASNTAGTSGGNIDGGGFVNTLNITNSIVAGGAAATGPDIRSGSAVINMNYSLLQNTAGAGFGGGNNITGLDPLLSALANNGGTTQTRLIAANSPARDAGSTAFVVVSATDQRGLIRTVGANVDMGAVEIQAPVVPATPATVPTLSQWALGLLMGLMAWLGLRRAPQRKRVGWSIAKSIANYRLFDCRKGHKNCLKNRWAIDESRVKPSAVFTSLSPHLHHCNAVQVQLLHRVECELHPVQLGSR